MLAQREINGRHCNIDPDIVQLGHPGIGPIDFVVGYRKKSSKPIVL